MLEVKWKAFVLRIKNNVSLEMLDNSKGEVGKNEREVEIRLLAFCDLEDRTEFRLATNLPVDLEHYDTLKRLENL